MSINIMNALESTLQSKLSAQELMMNQLQSIANTFCRATSMEPSKSANILTFTTPPAKLKRIPSFLDKKALKTQKLEVLKNNIPTKK